MLFCLRSDCLFWKWYHTRHYCRNLQLQLVLTFSFWWRWWNRGSKTSIFCWCWSNQLSWPSLSSANRLNQSWVLSCQTYQSRKLHFFQHISRKADIFGSLFPFSSGCFRKLSPIEGFSMYSSCEDRVLSWKNCIICEWLFSIWLILVFGMVKAVWSRGSLSVAKHWKYFWASIKRLRIYFRRKDKKRT